MNIFALKGHKVICTTFNAGYGSDTIVAKKYLTLNNVYTIDHTEVDNWSTTVFLQEFPNVKFNSLFFDDYQPQSTEDNQKHPDWIKFNKTTNMNNKISEIKEKKPTTLPDGTYIGKWTGNIIDLNYLNKDYELITETSVKGLGLKVVITIKNGSATFTETNN